MLTNMTSSVMMVSFCVLGITMIIGLFNLIYPPVKTVCAYSPMGEQFDCGIIYSHLKEHMVEGAVESSLANIEATACSDSVLNELEQKSGKTANRMACVYYCCITDGPPVNQQAYSKETWKVKP